MGEERTLNVCVVGGAGYVGLITGLGLAEIGHRVTSIDVDRKRVQKLAAGESPIYEDGLESMLKRNLDAGRLRFSTDLQEGLVSSEVVLTAVGTPSAEDGQADLSHVIQVAESIAKHQDDYKVIVIKSTVPVGAVDLVLSILSSEKKEGVDFDVVANPEFLREGKGLYDFFCPDRIVIGGGSDKARGILRGLYQPIILGEVPWPADGAGSRATGPVPVVETDLVSAQMIKYASNAFLATRVSFINEIAGVCERVGGDVKDVARGMGFDLRIGHDYLEAGIGFGGPCLEKDLRALIKVAEGSGCEPHFLRAVLERNERQVGEVVTKLKGMVGNLLYRKVVAVFGLSFKAGTSDVRNSLALRAVDRLEKEGAIVRAHDPVAIPEALAVNPGLDCHEDPYEAVRGADALLLLTEWPSFRGLDYHEIKSRMAHPRIVDARNILDPAALRELGFTYLGMGRT